MHLIWLVNFFKNRKLFSLEELVLTIPSLTNELICWLQKLKYCRSKEVFNSLQNLSQNLAITPVISEVFLFFTISYQETTAEPFFFLWLALTIQKLWVLQNLWLQNSTNTLVHMVTLHQKDTFSLSIAFERIWRSFLHFWRKTAGNLNWFNKSILIFCL